MLSIGARSLAGGWCAARKANSAGCCGVDLVLVSPGLDPAYSPAVVAQEALSTRCSQTFLPLPDPVCAPDEQNPDVTHDTIDQTISYTRAAVSAVQEIRYTRSLKAYGPARLSSSRW